MLECVTRRNYFFVEQGPGEGILQVRVSGRMLERSV